LSHYVPDWVKEDFYRFPRIQIYNGKRIEALTPLSKELLKADKKAYVAMMRHLKKVDEKEQTVIMIQMQNEVGVLGDSRDRSETANIAFEKEVPEILTEYIKKNKDQILPALKLKWEKAGSKLSGSWNDLFGEGHSTDELFMAWHYARFMGNMTRAGKEVYELPVYVNAWIVQPEDKNPGDYPSGGPQAHVHDIWRAAAPSIDILAPDIYLQNFIEVCKEYSRAGNTGKGCCKCFLCHRRSRGNRIFPFWY